MGDCLGASGIVNENPLCMKLANLFLLTMETTATLHHIAEICGAIHFMTVYRTKSGEPNIKKLLCSQTTG